MRRQLWVNGALLALALGTLGVVWATRESVTTADVAARRDKLLPSFDKSAVTSLILTRGAERVELVKAADGELRIVKPWQERADVGSVNQLLGALDLASALRPADGATPAQAGLTPQALTLQLTMRGETARIRLGGPAPTPQGARYAEVQTGAISRKYVVTQGVASELDQPFDKLRETRLLEYGRSDFTQLSFEQSGRKLELVQQSGTLFFKRPSGASELANRDVVERVFTALARFSSEHFVEPEQARANLGADALHLRLELEKRKLAPVNVTLGGACPNAAELVLLLREQDGVPARAACVARELMTALAVSEPELEVLGPFAARVDEVEELRLRQGALSLELARKGMGFVLRKPSSGDVPLDAGNARISAILRAKGTRAPSAASSHFDATGEMALRLAGGDEASARTAQVALGKPAPDGKVCAKRSADAVVLCFDAETARAFEPNADELRGLALPGFAASELLGFDVKTASLEQRVVRRPDGSYQLEQPPGFAHDGALVADAVQTLGNLQAARWVAASSEPRFGLAAARLRVSVRLSTQAEPRELVIGAATNGGYFAQLSPDPGVFVLPGAAFVDLSTPLLDRALCPYPEAELQSILLTSRGKKLLLTRRGDTWDGAQAFGERDLLPSLTALRADFALHIGPARAEEGFGKPRLELTFTRTEGARAVVSVGACETLNDTRICYARQSGVDATFALSERLVSDLQDSTSDEHR